MSVFTKLRTILGQDEPPLPPENEERSQEARQAYENAKLALGEARQRREQVREVASSLAALRKRNHFGESIEIAMTRKGGRL